MEISGILGFALTLTFFGLIILFLVAGRGKTPNLRAIPAFARLREAIGRSMEAGSRLHLSLGRGSITGAESAAGFIGLSALDGMVRTTSSGDNPLVATSGDAVLSILASDTLASAYQALGIEAALDPTRSQLSGLTPFSFASGAFPVLADEKTVTHVFLGHFGSEIALMGDRAERSQHMTLAGSDHLVGQAVLFASVDEPLLGEELYASGAYIHKHPLHIASLQAQDVIRWLLVGAILAGAVVKSMGLTGWMP